MTDTATILSSLGSSAGPSAAATAKTQIAGTFDTFLKLLTTQLQHQDPLSPMDSNQFTQQLVQFAGVEQSIATNQNLETLVNFALASATSSAVGYIGREVTAGGETAAFTQAGGAQWHYTLPRGAAKTDISIVDAAGNTVYKSQGEIGQGEHVFDWDGRTLKGGQAPAGNYKIVIDAKDAGGNSIAATATVKGIVKSVDIDNGVPYLNVGGLSLRFGDVISVSAAPATPASPSN